MQHVVRSVRLLIGCAVLTACSSDHAGGHNGGGTSGKTDAGAGFGNAAGADSTGSGTAGSFGNASAAGSSASANKMRDAGVMKPGAAECVGKTQDAEQVEVDMYIMLDRSDSMSAPTGAGVSKWDAMRQALSSFFADSQSSGLGVGLQYFPIGIPDVPEHCMTDTECGTAGGACGNKACTPSRVNLNPTLMPCLADADCPRGYTGCMPYGVCEQDTSYVCSNFGPTGCEGGNPPLGACLPANGSCVLYASCDMMQYQTPAVPIALLPGNAQPLTDSLQARMPAGLTPTPVALLGAIGQGSSYAKSNPSHRVITVLATDGLPTDCVPQGTTTIDQAVTVVANIAAQGLAATPSITTYVIGVFSDADGDAMTKLDQMAAAGGSDHALIVDVNQDVAQQFLAALASIRSGILSCDFELPKAPSGQTLDYGLVNVEFDQGSGMTSDLLYVKTADQCGKANLGWFYDTVPSAGNDPTKISVCPGTCDMLRAAKSGAIKISLGCSTKGPL